jgi:hypothetical protein
MGQLRKRGDIWLPLLQPSDHGFTILSRRLDFGRKHLQTGETLLFQVVVVLPSMTGWIQMRSLGRLGERRSSLACWKPRSNSLLPDPQPDASTSAWSEWPHFLKSRFASSGESAPLVEECPAEAPA